jgi:hypothetical protein
LLSEIAECRNKEGGDVMTETALFVGWGGAFPGREHAALEGFHEWMRILEESKQKGEIEDFMNVLLGPHGGELDGFTLVFGEQAKLVQLSEREDIHRMEIAATREFAKFMVVPATTGKLVDQEYKLLEEEILPALERTPVAA